MAVSPEDIGLCGCWQVLAVQRETINLAQAREKGATPNPPPAVQTGYYATSLHEKQCGDNQLLQIVRDHWAAIENGSHLRRDVTCREDECQVSKRGAAQVLATLRNLALGLYELQRERGGTKTPAFKAWCRKMTGSAALKLILRH